jgi:hypothetical protein
MDQPGFQKNSDGKNGLVRKVLHFMNTAFVASVNPCLALILAGLSFSALLSAQEAEAFKPGGKPEIRIFSSLNSAFTDGENHTKFDVTRAYLGYNYNFTKNLSGRIVYDAANPTVGKLQFTGMLKFAYLKYQTDKWTISGVYNYQKNNNMMAGHDYQVLSFNGSIPVKDKIKIFGRFDYLYSETVETEEDPWNQAKDGRLYLIGIDIAIATGIHISPNYQGWQPAGTDMPFISRLSLSLDLKI